VLCLHRIEVDPDRGEGSSNLNLNRDIKSFPGLGVNEDGLLSLEGIYFRLAFIDSDT